MVAAFHQLLTLADYRNLKLFFISARGSWDKKLLRNNILTNCIVYRCEKNMKPKIGYCYENHTF